MRPVFEHALVDALRLLEVGAAIGGDAAVEDVMVAALDHIDGVDLHIAEMLDRGRGRRRPLAERRRRIQPLRPQPDAPGLCLGQGYGIVLAGHVPRDIIPDSGGRTARHETGHRGAAPRLRRDARAPTARRTSRPRARSRCWTTAPSPSATSARRARLQNLKTNPRIEVNFVDVFVRKGYRFAGTAIVVERGEPDFEALLPKLAQHARAPHPRDRHDHRDQSIAADVASL